MPASRLVSILLLLQSEGRMTAQELADELEVTVRTVYRDMDSLAAALASPYGEAGHEGGYRLVDGYPDQIDRPHYRGSRVAASSPDYRALPPTSDSARRSPRRSSNSWRSPRRATGPSWTGRRAVPPRCPLVVPRRRQHPASRGRRRRRVERAGHPDPLPTLGQTPRRHPCRRTLRTGLQGGPLVPGDSASNATHTTVSRVLTSIPRSHSSPIRPST